MSELELMRIRKWVQSGARLMLGSDHAGRRKIKVVRGPFGLLTRRYRCTEQDVVRLQTLLREVPKLNHA